MATSNDEIYIKILTDIEQSVTSLDSLVKKLAATYLSYEGLKKIIVSSIQAFVEAEQAATKLSTSLRITDQYSKESMDALLKMGEALQKTTIYSHELTSESAALLIQLGNLSVQGVEKLMPHLQDFASSIGLDLPQAAELVGKTLGGTTNMLGRYGIVVTETKDKGVEFDQIMQQMTDKFSGMAVAIGKTTGGELTRFKNQIDDAKVASIGLIEAWGGKELSFLKTWGNELAAGFQKVAYAANIFGLELRDIAGFKMPFGKGSSAGLFMNETGFPEAEATKLLDWWDKMTAASEKAGAAANAAAKAFAAAASAEDLAYAATEAGHVQAATAYMREGAANPFAMTPGPTTMPQGIFNPNQTSNGPQLLNDLRQNDKYFSSILDSVRKINTGLSYVPKELEAISPQVQNTATLFAQIEQAAISIGTSLAKGDIQGAMSQMAKLALDALMQWATLAAAKAYWQSDWANFALFAGIAGLAVAGEIGLAASQGSSTSSAVTDSGGSSGKSIVVNVQGSVISERGLARSIAAQMSNW